MVQIIAQKYLRNIIDISIFFIQKMIRFGFHRAYVHIFLELYKREMGACRLPTIFSKYRVDVYRAGFHGCFPLRQHLDRPLSWPDQLRNTQLCIRICWTFQFYRWTRSKRYFGA